MLEGVERAMDLPAPRRERLLSLVTGSHPEPDVRDMAASLARDRT